MKLPGTLQVPGLSQDEIEGIVELNERIREQPRFLPYLKKVSHRDFEDLGAVLKALNERLETQAWRATARSEQLMPGTPGSFSDRTDWRTWLLLGGRGSGKSRAAAEAIRELIISREWRTPPRIALVSTTLDAVRIDMVESQLLPALGYGTPHSLVAKYNRSTVEIFCHSGAYLKGYSSERPQRLRGPNFAAAWADEPAAWFDADKAPSEDSTWSNLEFATRIEDDGTWVPRIIATTTPKPVRLLRIRNERDEHYPGIVDDEGTVTCHLKSMDNVANLAEIFRRRVLGRYKGTRLGRQELEGVLLDAAEGALWTPELISARRGTIRDLTLNGGIGTTIISIDPSVGDGSNDECGLVVLCVTEDGEQAWVLEDRTMRGRPHEWAKEAVEAFVEWDCDYAVAELNHGYEMVLETLQRESSNIPIRAVLAKRGKQARADPVSLLTEQDRVRFAGDFPLLEDQLTTWEPTSGKASPDRLDAFVQGVLDLLPVHGGRDDMYTDYSSGFEGTR